MHNFTSDGSMEFGSRGTTESIADMNPDDIESISVMTGAAAAALYGSDAANGAMLITTKKGKAGATQIQVSSNTEFMNPLRLPDFQTRYGTGRKGKASGSTIHSWGAPLNQAARYNYSPEDFLQTGHILTNSVTLSGGTEKNQIYFSTAAVNSKGLIPNNKYNRYNFTFRNTSNLLNDRLTLDVSGSYIIQKDRNMITGTAFFIDKEGTLMTNRHVAQPDIDAVTARRSMIRFMKTLKQFFTEQMAELSQQYDQLESQKSSCSYFDFYGFIHTDQERLAQINAQQAELSEQFTALKQSREGIDDNIDPEGIKIRTISELGIAYNNTYVTSESDFIIKNPCVVVRTSDKENIDLALIQLKNKKTPENTYIFKLKGDDSERSFTDKLATLFSSSDDDKLKIDQQLYMIGYNAGLVLANTKQGIKVQMTSGKVTQLSDGQRLLYSIPTLQGSSGSPVIDEYGNLVAVNFAKLGTTDNFNFGIPEESIKEFMRK